MANTNIFGPLLKTTRIEREKTLREFCSENQLDPGNYSKLERGILPPPQDRQVLERYARALHIQEGSDEWYAFFDAAAASKGHIPADLMSDEQLVRKLPVLFRTIRNQQGIADNLDALAELIRRS